MIKSVVAKNFQSWEMLKFNITQGITLIDGWNQDDQTSEGSGKSAILNAICWGLYGKLPKTDVKIDDVIKDGQKSCEVKVDLFWGSVVRSRKPNDLKIVKTDGEVIKGKDSKETQDLIEQMIGMSFDTFCQTRYFAQNYPKKFITTTQEERGKILSEVQNLKVFDKARKEVQGLLKIEEEKERNYTEKCNTTTIKIQHCKDLIAQQKRFIDQQEQEKENRICNIQLKIKNITDKIQDNDRLITALESQTGLFDEQELLKDKANLLEAIEPLKSRKIELEVKLRNLHNTISDQKRIILDISRYELEIQKIEKNVQDLNEFIENPTKTCPTCGTELSNQDTLHASEELKRKVNQYNSTVDILKELRNRKINENEFDSTTIEKEIQSLNSTIKEINDGIQSADFYISSNRETRTKINNTITSIKVLSEQLVSLQQDLKNEINKPIEYDNKVMEESEKSIDQLNGEFCQLTKLHDECKIRIHQLECLKLGFKEVKSYTFNSVLQELSIKSNNYLIELFEIPISLKFINDNMKIHTEITIDGHTRGYGMLSGGQQRRVALSVDLALSDIVSSRTGLKNDIKILDEYFKDLSENSMQKCLHLLERIGGSTILIEHNSIFKSIVDNVFQVELINGSSKQVP